MNSKWFIKERLTHELSLVSLLFLIFLILAPTSSLSAYSKSAHSNIEDLPRSFSIKSKLSEYVELVTLTLLDNDRLLAEDAVHDKDLYISKPYRFAIDRDVTYTYDNSGLRETLSEGELWRLHIKSPKAKSLSIVISRFDVPKEAKLWIYDPGGKQTRGPYTVSDRKQNGGFITLPIGGDEILVEVFIPTAKDPIKPAIKAPIKIEIGKVIHGYQSANQHGKIGDSAYCTQEVNDNKPINSNYTCPAGTPLYDQLRAVGLIILGNQEKACSGTLLNNKKGNSTPYFLTALHCFPDINPDPRNLPQTLNTNTFDRIVWHYQHIENPITNPSCRSPLSAAPNVPAGETWLDPNFPKTVSAEIVAANPATDLALLRLGTIPTGVYKAGWDTYNRAPLQATGIHHPKGDVMAINTSNAISNSNIFQVTWNAASNNNPVITEPGSSGSCLFDNNKRCIGYLNGGPLAVCPSNYVTRYSKISNSWEPDCPVRDPISHPHAPPNDNDKCKTGLRDWLDPEYVIDPSNSRISYADGDAHIKTLNGIPYDFQGAGEYVLLHDPNGLEIQTRQTPVATNFTPGPDRYDGLATCVSVNTAVAVSTGSHRVTYQPSFIDDTNPSQEQYLSRLQLRIDGKVTTLNSTGITLSGGGRIEKTNDLGGLKIEFPDSTVLKITPDWWESQNTWYMNIEAVRPPVLDGAEANSKVTEATRGLMAAIPEESWLPELPDGATVGPMPKPKNNTPPALENALKSRFDQLYHQFGDSWRVNVNNTLFDYEEGTSTETYTNRNWPQLNGNCLIPQMKPIQKPASLEFAKKACERILIQDKNTTYRNCLFDVMTTGNVGFAQTYLDTLALRPGATRTDLSIPKTTVKYGENVSVIVNVSKTNESNAINPTGKVQLLLDDVATSSPVKLDRNSRAELPAPSFKVGQHRLRADYIPSPDTGFLSSRSTEVSFTVLKSVDYYWWLVYLLLGLLIAWILWKLLK